jgi:hypothetical protein
MFLTKYQEIEYNSIPFNLVLIMKININNKLSRLLPMIHSKVKVFQKSKTIKIIDQHSRQA